jgi:coenzyme F420-reducing hydrogenase beta subunit
MSMVIRTKEDEHKIVDRHIALSKDGFKALEKVTAFCCSGCGLCISICPLGSIIFDETKKRPLLLGECDNCGYCYLACPRSFLPLTKIEETYFGTNGGEETKRLGLYNDLFVARSRTEEIYREGTPGGTTTALVHFLLEGGYVDAVLLTRGKHPDIRYCMHPEPYITSSPQEVLASAHSKFEISPVLAYLGRLSEYGKTLFVGTPCHIMAFRKLQIISKDSVFGTKMKGLTHIAQKLTARVRFALSINCFLNNTSMDKTYEWLQVQEQDIIRFNENVTKELADRAFKDGKNWRWFIKNSVTTRDGRVKDYDVLQLGKLILYSGCLVCNNMIVSRHGDANIGFFGGETGVKEFGWNMVSIMNPSLKEVVDKMVAEKKLERKPILRNYGRTLRKMLEVFLRGFIPARDFMGVKHYLQTGAWNYPGAMKKIKGPRRGTYILGLELLFLAQTFRKKMFYDSALKALKKAGAYHTTVY